MPSTSDSAELITATSNEVDLRNRVTTHFVSTDSAWTNAFGQGQDAQILEAFGFTQLTNVPAGYAGWEPSGLPIDTVAAPPRAYEALLAAANASEESVVIVWRSRASARDDRHGLKPVPSEPGTTRDLRDI